MSELVDYDEFNKKCSKYSSSFWFSGDECDEIYTSQDAKKGTNLSFKPLPKIQKIFS